MFFNLNEITELDEVATSLNELLGRLSKKKKKIDYLDYKKHITARKKVNLASVVKEVDIQKEKPDKNSEEEKVKEKIDYVKFNKK